MCSYLVADKITVTSKSAKDGLQWKWESSAGNSYTIAPDEEGEIEGSGTRIVLQLKEESDE